MILPRAFYFGCLDDIGHHLFRSEGGHCLYFDGFFVEMFENSAHFTTVLIPWAPIDGGVLRGRQIPDEETGRVFGGVGAAADGTPWHAFAWWDRSVDSRPGSNSGFYVCGYSSNERDVAFAYACRTWPTVVARQHRPLVLQPVNAGLDRGRDPA